MKRFYLFLIIALCAITVANAQNQVRVHNNTGCAVNYMLYLDNGGCVDAVSNMFSIPAGAQTAHTVTLTAWPGYGTPLNPTAQFSGARVFLNLGLCPNSGQVANACAGGPGATTVTNTCSPMGCPSINASWVQTAGGGYVLTFN